MIIVLLSFPACSSGNDMVDDVFEIIEKTDTITDDSTSGKTNNGDSTKDGQTQPSDKVFKLDPFFPLTKGGGPLEGAALYGDYLFHATAKNAIHIYDIRQKKYLTMLNMGSMGHADTMSFGIQRVEETDEFPVLYVSGSQSNTPGNGGDIYVYRIVRSIDESGSEKWQGALIQHITTPDVAVIGSFPDVVIDQDNRIMWVMGWLTAYEYNHEDGSGCSNCFSKYNIPDIRDGTLDAKGVYQLTLKEEERLSYFMIYDIHAITQGLCYFNGKIICPYGNSFKGIDVIDVTKERLVYHVNLRGSRIGEPEAAVIYNNELYVLGQGDYVYSCSGLDL